MGKLVLWVTTKVSRTFTHSTKLFHRRKPWSVVPAKTVMTLGVTNDERHIWLEHNWIVFSLLCSFHLNPIFWNRKKPDSSRMNWICMWVSFRRYVYQVRLFMRLSGASRTTVPFGKPVGALNSVSKSVSDGRWAGVLWFIYPRIRIAIGRRRTLWSNRPWEIVLGSIWSQPPKSMWVLSMTRIDGKMILTPFSFTKALCDFWWHRPVLISPTW